MAHHSVHLLRFTHPFHHIAEQRATALGIHRIVIFLHTRASLRLNRSRQGAAEADELWPSHVRLRAEHAVHTLMHSGID